jgi:uncharacterized protein YkwD
MRWLWLIAMCLFCLGFKNESQEYMLARINAVRASYRLPAVGMRKDLECASRSWSKELWRTKTCRHFDPAKREYFWDRVRICGGSIIQGGEIVACGYQDIDAAIVGWLNSPQHRNIFLSRYTKVIGVGWAGEENAQHWYTMIADMSPGV